MKVMADQQAVQDSQNLSMNLATQNKIRDTLKSRLGEIQVIFMSSWIVTYDLE